VTSLLDVGQPLWPQFRKLTSDSDDEADFQADPLDDFENFKYKVFIQKTILMKYLLLIYGFY
jgi:hypothetical protein